MPDGTTKDQDKEIATKGTLHVARATEPDVCKVPPKDEPKPFDNWVPSQRLTKGQTVKSFIAGYPVWTAVGELGPPSEPAHEGTHGGVKSGTYRDVARPTSYSNTTFFEGNGAVRLDDTTTQNKENTVGKVVWGPAVGIFIKADQSDFEKALKDGLVYEGGLVDDPDDPGGRTNKGITQKNYDKYRKEKGLPQQDVANIGDSEVRDIYQTKYWNNNCDNLTPRLARAHYDWSINHGNSGATKTLQGVLGVPQTGTFDQATKDKLNEALKDPGSEDKLLDQYLRARENWYNNRVATKPSQAKFLKGWLNRTNAVRDKLAVPGAKAVIHAKPNKKATKKKTIKKKTVKKKKVKKKK